MLLLWYIAALCHWQHQPWAQKAGYEEGIMPSGRPALAAAIVATHATLEHEHRVSKATDASIRGCQKQPRQPGLSTLFVLVQNRKRHRLQRKRPHDDLRLTSSVIRSSGGIDSCFRRQASCLIPSKMRGIGIHQRQANAPLFDCPQSRLLLIIGILADAHLPKTVQK